MCSCRDLLARSVERSLQNLRADQHFGGCQPLPHRIFFPKTKMRSTHTHTHTHTELAREATQQQQTLSKVNALEYRDI
jgi:hypothetical protein